MNYLHYKLSVGPEKRIRVALNGRANVRLLDTLNYYKFTAGKPFQSTREYLGTDRVEMQAPHSSHWHVVIDHGDYRGELRASVDVLDG